MDGVAVKLDDDIAPVDAGLGGRDVGVDLGHQGAFRFGHAEGLGQFRRDVLDLHPDHAPHHLALGLQLGNDGFGDIAGSGKPDALAGGHDGGVDADHLSLKIEQGAAAVARVDGGVGLEEVVIGTGADNPALGADNPLGDGMTQAKGVAHGHDPVSYLDGVGIPQLQKRQVRPAA